jgi:hypothetical protein
MKTIPPNSPSESITPELHEAIGRRAEEIYIQNGRVPGHDIENWSQAEREIMEEVKKRNTRAAVIVKVNGVQYVGEYRPQAADGYLPGEFDVGSPVAVRLEEDKMYVRRTNGKELQTRIVQKIS